MPDYYCWTAGCWWSATALTTLSSPPTLGECLKVLANLIFLEVTLKYIRASLLCSSHRETMTVFVRKTICCCSCVPSGGTVAAVTELCRLDPFSIITDVSIEFGQQLLLVFNTRVDSRFRSGFHQSLSKYPT